MPIYKVEGHDFLRNLSVWWLNI